MNHWFGRFHRRLLGAVLVLATTLAGGLAQTQNLTALARLTGGGIAVHETRQGLNLIIEMTQPLPWRIFTLENPKRVVVDFSELEWTGFKAAALRDASDWINGAQAGLFRPGWTRLVLELGVPLAVVEAGMTVQSDGTAVVSVWFEKTDDADFATRTGAPENAIFTPSRQDGRAFPAHERQTGDRPLRVVLDPGHGGIDPGAERDGAVEADLMLQFARELKELLLRSGRFEVELTRETDVFVPLETRVTIARRAAADVFISLHADILVQGNASGASVYTLSKEASDLASQKLAERHDRADLLAGVDLTRQGDGVALILMDLARLETTPRSEHLADALVEGIYSATGTAHKNARLSAGFSVLKAPDIPSVLVELGYLSSTLDRENLQSQTWRLSVAEGIRDALLYWAIEDAAEAARLRQ